jgi:hypothetical protein
MKSILFSVVFVLIVTNLFSQDFQPFKFGDPAEKIKMKFDSDSTQIGRSMDGMEFIMPIKVNDTCSISGVKSMFVYYLLDEKLEGVRFFTIESHDDLNKYLEDYKKITNFLSSKYEKVETREFWNDEKYKNDPSKLAFAVSIGQYEISTTYKDGTTTIVHILTKYSDAKRPIYQMIDYSSNKCMEFYKNTPLNGRDILRRTK